MSKKNKNIKKAKSEVQLDISSKKFQEKYIEAVAKEIASGYYSYPTLDFLNYVDKNGTDLTKIPHDYRDQVRVVKLKLKNDVSGIVNTVLNFAISSASVKYKVKSKYTSTDDVIYTWMQNINEELRGRIPVGIEALAKQYYLERWKGSSNLILRTFWDYIKINNSTYYLPTQMWFVDGKDIIVEEDKQTKILGQEDYKLIVSNKNGKIKTIPLGVGEDELIYVQRPYDDWSTFYPVPYLIRQGVYKNMLLLELIAQKGGYIVSAAMEYMLAVKKGTERMFLERNKAYSDTELKSIKEHMSNIMSGTNNKVPLGVTNFDTTYEHLVPPYEKVLKEELFTAVKHRILSGLGLVDVIQDSLSTTKKAVLNPKPFIAEVEDGVSGFTSILKDIVADIKKYNQSSHKRVFSDNNEIHITHNSIITFIDDKYRAFIRNIWEKGQLDTPTLFEHTLPSNINYEDQVVGRKEEKKYEELMYPRVIQNMEKDSKVPDFPKEEDTLGREIPEDKTDPNEKQNYNRA